MMRFINRIKGWIREQRDFPFWENTDWGDLLHSFLTTCVPGMLIVLMIWAVAILSLKAGHEMDIAEYQKQIQMLEAENSKRLEKTAALESENEQLRAELRRLDELMEQGNADDVDESAYNEAAWMPAGDFRIYHYCPCEYCCGKKLGDPGYGITATGTVATAGRTIAVDPDVIPLGSEVLINGVIYIAEDTGVHGKTIDLFVDDHAQAAATGTYITGVWWR